MKLVILIAVMFALSACGSGESPSCAGVDTSRAPDSVVVNGNLTTYTWGGCTKVY